MAAARAAPYTYLRRYPPVGASAPGDDEWLFRNERPRRRGAACGAPPDALKRPAYVEDKDSGELRRPHHIDLKTGMYRGRQVLKVKTES